MNYLFEQDLIKDGFQNVCGIAEVGRGPLAGPLVCAAVILDPDNIKPLKKLKESKSITGAKRDQFFGLIKEYAKAWSIGMVHSQEIDQHGLAFANKIAMKRAWQHLSIKPDYILIDYLAKIYFETPFKGIVQGDKKVLSIAAASIIAKVSRDRIMQAFAQKYPEYGFDLHKGYGTKLHLEKIKKFGPCSIHRKTFEHIKARLL